VSALLCLRERVFRNWRIVLSPGIHENSCFLLKKGL
jgi:hypothetical protein